ncbi:MAG TPA: GNAT family N-acetyltransferase [Candidatus Methylomirabilis sp.]|nr:GNAT family N-acetyltransferase [Candidatus Methylomirabilis sp.]
MTDPTLRVGVAGDAKRCGMICYEAFKGISEAHGFPLDFPSPDVAVAMLAERLSHPGYHVIVAELDGRIVGSNVLDERSPITGLGPITVDPSVQNRTIGRQLMQAALRRVAERRAPGLRLVQSTFHRRSLSLYTKLGFETRELLVNLQGPALSLRVPGHAVRPAASADVDACDALCRRIHGHDRHGELLDGIKERTATVVEHDGRITGYATMVGFIGHAVSESNTDLKALIGGAKTFMGPGLLLPARNGDVFRWCLEHGLQVVQPMTLMSLGLYNEPRGAFLPSILF